jgi:hypothetical protein
MDKAFQAKPTKNHEIFLFFFLRVKFFGKGNKTWHWQTTRTTKQTNKANNHHNT